jgi:hypothetical protein
MAMVEPDRWVDVRALVGPSSMAWVKRYAPAPADRVTMAGLGTRVAAGVSRAVETARLAAAGPIWVDEIIEGNANTEAEAVRAWIVEQGDPLRLDADRLIRLADAGVPPEVIDVAVAVSFPDRFAVDRQARGDRDYGRTYGWNPFGGWGSWSPWGGYYDPFWYHYGYDRYRYGYNAWGPSVVVVRPVMPSRGSPGGRMVKGRGYVPAGGSARGTATRPSVRTSPPSSASRGVSGSASSGSRGKAKRRGSGG